MPRIVTKVEYTCRVCPEKDGKRTLFDSPLEHMVTKHPTHLNHPLGMLYDQILVVPTYEEVPDEDTGQTLPRKKAS